jgi:hydrogenase maturation protein HypF
MTTRSQILVRGIVQGVGFRPFVYSLAKRYALRGQVRNNATGVLIEVEGDGVAIDGFVGEIASSPPPLATVESIERSEPAGPAAPMPFDGFRIVESDAAGRKFVPVSADVATCADCLRELRDPADRRHQYPFVNCTNCGPRFTIIEDVPYDRAKTTMRAFEMCGACEAEYRDPLDRRFHAEPTACPTCGPRVYLADSRGLRPDGELESNVDAVGRARSLLLEGHILAIKGVGGFHLACDALDASAVERLRRRKYREDKPFALMAATVEMVRRFCAVSDEEEALLASSRRPIVLLHRRPDAALPDAVAPRVRSLGFMLPYTPLHHLLLEGLGRPLVMTSGNVSDEPICYDDADALERLGSIADAFLLHDRRIHMRADDTVTRVFAGREMVLRRSRGYAPAPIKTTFGASSLDVLACGAELKNTFCITHGDLAFVSHHIGDLENLETLESFTRGVEHYKQLFNLSPSVVAYDLHPEYLSTKYALALDDELVKIGVQHHHAHVASCMADNRAEGEVIGVAMDGLGFGTDGRLWGGEFLVASFARAERVAHLEYVPLPGGAKAIREPWRMAAIYLDRAVGGDLANLPIPFAHDLDRGVWTTLRRMAETGTNSPETSSMGRLFDAVSSLLGLRRTVRYEGQAAIELEQIADPSVTSAYDFAFSADGSIIKADVVLRRIVEDLVDRVPLPVISARFHCGVANLITTVAERVRDERRLGRVALSGGVFQNLFLLERTCGALAARGFDVLTHSRVPPNDGGISLGQAAVAHALIGESPCV